MHPSNRDHKDMQKRGVQTFQARVGSGVAVSGGYKIKTWTCLVASWLSGRAGEVKGVLHLK